MRLQPNVENERIAYQPFAGHFFDPAVVLQKTQVMLVRRSRNKPTSLAALFCLAYRAHNGRSASALIMRTFVRADVRDFKEKGILPYYVMSTYWHADAKFR